MKRNSPKNALTHFFGAPSFSASHNVVKYNAVVPGLPFIWFSDALNPLLTAIASLTLAARALAATSTVTSPSPPLSYSPSERATDPHTAGSKWLSSPVTSKSFREREPSNSTASCAARSARWKVEALPVVETSAQQCQPFFPFLCRVCREGFRSTGSVSGGR